MKACAFDALLDFGLEAPAKELRAEAHFLDGPSAVRITEYPRAGRKEAPFVRVLPASALNVRWRDPFEVRTAAGALLGRGTVLFPCAPGPDELKPAKRKALLARLALGEKDMLLALAERGGLKGLSGDEVAAFCRLAKPRVEALARGLAEEGRIRILVFSPLFLVSQEGLDFLRGRTLAFLARYHQSHA